MLSDARRQLAHEFAEMAARLWAVIPALPPVPLRACRQAADELATRCLAGDSTAGAEILSVLWPHRPPEVEGRAEWWRSPVGRLVACALAQADYEPVSRRTAANMLGVTDGTVAVLTHRGKLERVDNGHVRRGSVLARLAGPLLTEGQPSHAS